MKKFAINVLCVLWMVVVFAAAIFTMYVTAVMLDQAMPEDVSIWVRFAIGVPCIFVTSVCVELMLLAIGHWLDRKGWLGKRED
jgi:NADH:ubiquinone oxidoreductase subunit 6 (subunit J)